MQPALRCIAVLFVATAVIPAQTAEGPYMGFPLQFLVGPNTYAAGGTTPVARLQMQAKDAGFTAFTSATTARPTDPRFLVSAPPGVVSMFGAVPTGFGLGAISTGFHYVFYNGATGMLDMEGRWGALLFSVTRNSTGAPGSLVRGEVTRPGGDGAAADLFSMVLPNSTLPTPMSCWPIGTPQLATDSGQMGFAVGPSGQKPELRDFDPYMSMYDDGEPVRSMLPNDPWVFFSLTAESLLLPAVQSHTLSWFGGNPAVQSGATILRTQWISAASPPHWTTPEVHLTNLQLGLTDPTDDIDALAVDEARNVLLLSLRKTVVRPTTEHQLMVATWTGSPFGFLATPATAYMYSSAAGPQRVADAAGIVDGDDIDGTCIEDPTNGAALPLSHGYLVYCGVPFAPGIPASLSVAVTRGIPATPSVSSYYTSVSGLDSVGFTDAANFVMLVVSFPGPTGNPYGGPATTLFFRPPLNTLGYETYRYDVPVLGQGLPWGAQLDFQWAALGATSIVVSPIARIGI